MANACYHQETGEASQSFRFESDRLVVAEADAIRAREFALAYLDLDLETPAPLPPRRRFTQALAALTGAAPRPFVCFRTFDSRPGRETLAVWRGPQAQEIVGELKARWREARRRAVVVDFAADPRAEIARFQRLLERGIVSAEECAAAVARIAARAVPLGEP